MLGAGMFFLFILAAFVVAIVGLMFVYIANKVFIAMKKDREKSNKTTEEKKENA